MPVRPHARSLRPALLLCSTLPSFAACGDLESNPSDAGGNCAPDPAACQSANASCGVLPSANGPCVHCGRCALPLICGGGGVANQCGCTPRSCAAEGIQCGEIDDGCGGQLSCGGCPLGEVCLEQRCQPVIPLGADCRLAPAGCAPGTTCCLVGTGTLCVTPTDQASCPGTLPDLITREATTRGSISVRRRNFEPTSCALAEGCVGAAGDRLLLVFGTFIENVGRAPVQFGAPRDGNGFVFDACSTHQHYHRAGFLNYSLHVANPDGSLGPALAQNQKVSHCLRDGAALAPESPPTGGFTCDSENATQGLTQGWGYNYPPETDCQWVDVSDVPSGDYVLQVVIDPMNQIAEEREDNNTNTFYVSVP